MRTVLFVALLGCATASVARPQAGAITSPSVSTANRTGIFIGFDPLAYASLTSDDITAGQAKGGSGVSLRFGWGFSERWALVMDVPVTALVVSDDEDYLMGHGDIALMYFPRAFSLWKRPLLPFVQVGGGLRYYVERRWAITLQGWWSSGEFNDERIGNTTTHNRNIAATSTRIQTGLEWHRGRRGR